jgi:hypothetical protein
MANFKKLKINYKGERVLTSSNILCFFFSFFDNNVYCLQFYVCLGPESPLDERQIMEDKLSSGIGSMPQTLLGQLCS